MSEEDEHEHEEVEPKLGDWQVLNKMVTEWEEIPPNEVATVECKTTGFSPFFNFGTESGGLGSWKTKPKKKKKD